jgi:hypothetical protein
VLGGLAGSQRRTGGAASALMLSRRAAGSWVLTRLGVEGMEDRECRKCGVRTQHERVDLTERAIDWTVFVCSECGAVARAPRAFPNWAKTG